MDITSLPSLSDFFEGADQWGEVLALLPVLVLLELILSADNAVALAAIARSSRQPEREGLALNLGIGIALVLRIALIVVAQWVLQNAWVQLLAAAYLVWLVVDHFNNRSVAEAESIEGNESSGLSRPFLNTVLLLAFTDLAFSIDSVAAAVAISAQIVLISTGAFIGIVALRFTSSLFIRWLYLYPRLETAGFLAVAFVALRLIVHVVVPSLNQPDWLTLVVVLFGLFLLIQSASLRLEFKEDALIVWQNSRELRRFSYDQWLSWRLFAPWLPGLFYFRETQSIHFLPILFSPKELREQLELRVGALEVPNGDPEDSTSKSEE